MYRHRTECTGYILQYFLQIVAGGPRKHVAQIHYPFPYPPISCFNEPYFISKRKFARHLITPFRRLRSGIIRVHDFSRLETRPIFSKHALLTKPTKDFFGAPNNKLAFFGPPTGEYRIFWFQLSLLTLLEKLVRAC